MQAEVAYRAGQLDEAVAELTAAVQRSPRATDERGLLFELLCVSGAFDRADRQLQALERQSPDAGPSVALWRQIVRAAQWREDVFAEGRAPEFLAPPDGCLRAQLEALVDARAGDAGAAADRLARAEEARPRRRGEADGVPFDDLRDLDDRLAGCFEILTSTGKYYWIPLERLQRVRFEAPARPRDLVWRQAEVEVQGGPSGVVYVPVVYPGAAGASVPQRLARETDWIDRGGGAAEGRGQRTLLVGEEARPILELGELVFDDGGAG